jgi:hypothetical protein
MDNLQKEALVGTARILTKMVQTVIWNLREHKGSNKKAQGEKYEALL